VDPVSVEDVTFEVSKAGPPATARSRRGRWASFHQAFEAVKPGEWFKVIGLSESNAKSLRTSLYNKHTAERAVLVNGYVDGQPDRVITVWALRAGAPAPADESSVDEASVEDYIANAKAEDAANELEGLVADLTD